MNEYTAEIEVRREDVEHLLKAVDKELNIKERAEAKVEIKGKNVMKIIIKAKDANAFRAALNSYLRILQSTENIQKEVKR